ncbi:solute carrier family 15 member 2-like [Apostichopus japonicus]|uniref:solute carrier family 15 member 2-like n=1 Tax=Stichopus japonicus TaxID=307972 RepID=UPI003AB84AF4
MAETIATYGSTDKPEVNESEVPKISGKGWGRVKKFVSGESNFPKSVFYIIGTEFCERFSYYGMRAVLVLYLTNVLLLEDSRATALYHIFIMLCYFTPMFGAMIADGLLGKYRTIMYISLLYMAGNIVMCLSALPPQTTGQPELIGPLVGLILIGFGTGGIKPCVSAFGGDQFSSDQAKSLQQFFSVFYFAINAGSVLSTFITPVFRHDVQCFDHDCYALAFGVPAVLMFVAVCVFFAGRTSYKVFPPSGNVVWVVIKASACALYKKISVKSGESKQHWLDWAGDEFDSNVLQDIKDLYHVLKMYILLPFFWALFDQQGSRWTLQAEHMDGNLGFYTIKPDQMQVMNPVLIIIMIPLFEGAIYPLMNRLNVPTRPLARMCTGMLLGGLAFVLAGVIQLRIEGSEILAPGDEQAAVKFINTSPCPIGVESSIFNGPIQYANDTEHFTVPEGDYDVRFDSSYCPVIKPSRSLTITLQSKEIASVIIYAKDNRLQSRTVAGKLDKAKKGRARVSVGNFAELLSDVDNLNVTLRKKKGKDYQLQVTPFNTSEFVSVEPGRYTLTTLSPNSSEYSLGSFTAGTGAIYRVILQPSELPLVDVKMVVYVDVEPNSVSMLWQIPQYLVITAGEILFSITGLEFSYSQAPATMKSCVQAAWLMTVAIGNLIIVIIAEAKFFTSQAAEFFLFAALMGVVILLFTVMAYFYSYITPSSFKEDQMGDVTQLISKPGDETTPLGGEMEELPGDTEGQQGL